jgi:hypothetical protein
MSANSFKVNSNMGRLIDELQHTFGVNTRAEVIRRALILASVAARHAGADRSVVIRGAEEPVDNAQTIRLDR